MESKVIEFAPIIIVVLFVFINWHLAVTPSELEKKHREILSEVEKKFVTWSVFNTLKEKVDRLDKKVDRVECKVDSIDGKIETIYRKLFEEEIE